MKRPAFQFYPGDWRKNAKLRRCSEAARGAWIDVMCVLHDFDEYGICRWPLADLARAAGVPIKLLRELSDKGVLKGADKNCAAYIFTPRHAGKDGDPVTLVEASEAPCWYCSRFVRDEHIRIKRGQSTQFSAENQPPKGAPGKSPNSPPKKPPKPPIGDANGSDNGERQGDGSSSSSSASQQKLPTTSVAGATPVGDGDDPVKAIFDKGVALLVGAGSTNESARSFIGKLRKEHNDVKVLQALTLAESEHPAHPVEWLTKTVPAMGGTKKISGVHIGQQNFGQGWGK